jgi:hypothetical protein
VSGVPTDEEILVALDGLDAHTAEDLETQWLEFKPWQNAKDAQAVAVEYAVCFANSEGGAVVFGVSDNVRGRANAIHGAHRYAIDLWRRGIHDATRPAMNVDVVELRVPDGAYDEKMAGLVAQWQREGREIDLDALLILTFLKEQRYIDSAQAAELLQLSRDHTMAILDRLSHPDRGILERRGETRTATFHLTKHVAKILLSKAAYTRTRGVEKARYADLVRQFVTHHGSITPAEIRDLLGLGDSQSARVQTSRMCREWSGPLGFLRLEGTTPRHRYVLR